MSSAKRLRATGKLMSAGTTTDGSAIVVQAPSLLWRTCYPSTPSSVSISVNPFTSWVWMPSAQDFSIVNDIVLTTTAITTDGTNLFTFYSPFKLLDSVKLYVNGSVISWLQDGYHVDCAANTYFRERVLSDELLEEQQSVINNLSTFSGDQITTTGTQIRFSMFKLFPFLKDMILNVSGIRRLQFDVTFASNKNSLANTQIGKSSTTSNAYNASISYTNLQFETFYYQASSADLIQPIPKMLMRTSNYYTFQSPNVSWTNVGTDNYLLQLNTAYPNIPKLAQGVHVFLYDNVNSGGAYNASTASQFSSGASVFSYHIRYQGSTLFDTTTDLTGRRNYESLVYKSRNIRQSKMPHNLIANSDLMGKYFVHQTFIDLSCVSNDEGDQTEVLSGRPTTTNEITIQFFCASSVSANCTLYFVMQYDKVYAIDGKSGGLLEL